MVDAPDDRCTLIEDVSRREAEALPITHDQIPLAFQISVVHLRFTVHRSVVFMDSTSSLDPQVRTGEALSVLIDKSHVAAPLGYLPPDAALAALIPMVTRFEDPAGE